MRDVIIEHNCRYESTGELYNNGSLVILKSEDHDDGYFEEGFPIDEGIYDEFPCTWNGYSGEVKDDRFPNIGGWVNIIFDKTFIRTEKTDEELKEMIRIIDLKRLLVPNLSHYSMGAPYYPEEATL